jgi:hypothetical protein
VQYSRNVFSRYDEIMGYLERMANDYPEFVKLTKEGTTEEGRKIMLVKIGWSTEGTERKAIFIDAGKNYWDRLHIFHIKSLGQD